MKAYLRTATGRLLTAANGSDLGPLTGKLGTTWDLEVIPDADIADAATGFFSVKQTEGGLLLAHGAWSPLRRDGTGWLFSINLTSGPLRTLVEAGTTELKAEGTFVLDGKTRKSQTLTFNVQRDLFAGTEDQPPEVAGQSRMGPDGYMQYTWDGWATWWSYAPALVDGFPRFGWSGPFTE